MLGRLREPQSRVDENRLNSRCNCQSGLPVQERPHLCEQVVVDRLGGHGLGRAFHVHDRHPGLRGSGHVEHRRVPQPPDVVHHRGPGPEALLGHLVLDGVDGDRDVELGGDTLHHGDHARQLLVDAHRCGAGTRALPTDVYDVRPLLRHGPRVGHRRFGLGVQPPV